MPLPTPSEFARHWDLDPGVVFLNHGSFGAAPREVKLAQQRLRDRMESEPVRFFVEAHRGLLDAARDALAHFIHCDPGDIAPVTNATVGVATVLQNLVDSGSLKPGDELLTNTHEYPACQNNLRRAAARTGAKVVSVDLPFPCSGPRAVVDAILAGVTPRTRLALISHVTSPTGLVLPVEDLVPALAKLGVETLVDGAHAPGMIESLDLSGLRPTYYTGNLHKWACAPKGSAFLYVSKERRARAPFRPVVLSNNAENAIAGRDQFLTEFDFVGTADYTPFHVLPETLGFMGGLLPGGWTELMRRNRALAIAGREVLCRTLGVEPPAPAEMLGSLATICLPALPPEASARLGARSTRYGNPLQDALLERWKIQVPVWGLAGKPYRTLRIAAQMYNTIQQYEYLAQALKAELAAELKP